MTPSLTILVLLVQTVPVRAKQPSKQNNCENRASLQVPKSSATTCSTWFSCRRASSLSSTRSYIQHQKDGTRISYRQGGSEHHLAISLSRQGKPPYLWTIPCI